ncbi:hypothetical protein [Hymenobacter negativus]|uniref:Uncharacterized protein n=1 Tax=Hymenobacter negativus TaxID=2795026 RepID=A0ABS0Q8Q6_9BACT|nr:hypothetical protein [Hymenobacter negativus]MBH8559005.1 hypothetical protein [Hymenobacter negativus]
MRLLLLSCCLLALSCGRGEFAGVESVGTTADDTTRVPADTRIGKLKAKTVIIQQGTGNVATPTDNTKAGQKGGSAATGPGAVASTTTTKPAGLPWWVFALVGVLSIAAWEWLTAKFSLTSWLPWRVKPG